MAFGGKPKDLFCGERLHRPDFLWAESVPGMVSGLSESQWWHKAREAVEEDVARWETVYEAMARYECRMEVKGKKGTTWLTVPGDRDSKKL